MKSLKEYRCYFLAKYLSVVSSLGKHHTCRQRNAGLWREGKGKVLQGVALGNWLFIYIVFSDLLEKRERQSETTEQGEDTDCNEFKQDHAQHIWIIKCKNETLCFVCLELDLAFQKSVAIDTLVQSVTSSFKRIRTEDKVPLNDQLCLWLGKKRFRGYYLLWLLYFSIGIGGISVSIH